MEVAIPNSPVHSQSMISYPYGEIDSGYSCGFHTGLDIVPYGETPANPDIYSISNGIVVSVSNNPNQALGCNVVILDYATNNYFRYCHLVLNSISVTAGTMVNTYTKLGKMGDTGNTTGIHLHLEYSTSEEWNCANFLNPCNFLGIPNQDNLIINFSGSPVPPAYLRKKFPWVLYANKIRKRLDNK